MPRLRVLLVGLGKAAALTAGALAERDDALVTAAVDPLLDRAGAAGPLGEAVALYPALEAVPSGAAYDLAVVATPTATHAATCRALLRGPVRPALVLCEKPLDASAEVVDDLLSESAASGTILRVLYHYAHAREIGWSLEQWASLVARKGPVASFEVRFEDPYSQELPERSDVLGSSWLDSGINALSVLARFVELERVVDAVRVGSTGCAVTLSGAGGVTGRVVTGWEVEAEVKRTALTFADGGVLELDHSTQTVFVDGEAAYSGGRAARADRYRRLFDAHLDGGETVYGDDLTRRLHRLLAEASPS